MYVKNTKNDSGYTILKYDSPQRSPIRRAMFSATRGVHSNDEQTDTVRQCPLTLVRSDQFAKFLVVVADDNGQDEIEKNKGFKTALKSVF